MDVGTIAYDISTWKLCDVLDHTCGNVRDSAAIDRIYIDIVKVQKNVKRRNTKKCPGVRRKFVMKYSTRLKTIDVQTLFGRSQIIEAATKSLDDGALERTGTYISLQQKDDRRHTWPASPQLAFVHTK